MRMIPIFGNQVRGETTSDSPCNVQLIVETLNGSGSSHNDTSVRLAAKPFKGARGPCSSTNTESPTSARATLALCGANGKKEWALQVGIRNVGQTENALSCSQHRQVQSADYESPLAFAGTICKALVDVGGGPIRHTEAAMAAMIA